jgi:hypothetical protein
MQPDGRLFELGRYRYTRDLLESATVACRRASLSERTFALLAPRVMGCLTRQLQWAAVEGHLKGWSLDCG